MMMTRALGQIRGLVKDTSYRLRGNGSGNHHLVRNNLSVEDAVERGCNERYIPPLPAQGVPPASIGPRCVLAGPDQRNESLRLTAGRARSEFKASLVRSSITIVGSTMAPSKPQRGAMKQRVRHQDFGSRTPGPEVLASGPDREQPKRCFSVLLHEPSLELKRNASIRILQGRAPRLPRGTSVGRVGPGSEVYTFNVSSPRHEPVLEQAASVIPWGWARYPETRFLQARVKKHPRALVRHHMMVVGVVTVALSRKLTIPTRHRVAVVETGRAGRIRAVAPEPSKPAASSRNSTSSL